jgi:hypothetical protein
MKSVSGGRSSLKVERGFETLDVSGRDHSMAGYAQFTAQIEKIVLHPGETILDGFRQSGYGQYDADGAVGFVDRAVGFDAQTLLRHSCAVAQAGGAVVARAGIDLGEPVAH